MKLVTLATHLALLEAIHLALPRAAFTPPRWIHDGHTVGRYGVAGIRHRSQSKLRRLARRRK